jgi:hypothetical protein
MKSCTKYIDEAIKKELKKLIKEANENASGVADEKADDAEVLDTLKKADVFLKDEKNRAEQNKKQAQKLMSVVKDPATKNVQTLTQKIETDKIKKIDTIDKNIETQTQKVEDKLKANKISKTTQTPGTTPGTEVSGSVSLGISESKTKNKTSFPMITRTFFTEQNEELGSNLPPIENSNKAYVVKFDKNTQAPFDVKFTKRGFSIDGTRLGFETIENALSKNYTITLGGGKGFVLNPIRMQQILKYKDKWF